MCVEGADLCLQQKQVPNKSGLMFNAFTASDGKEVKHIFFKSTDLRLRSFVITVLMKNFDHGCCRPAKMKANGFVEQAENVGFYNRVECSSQTLIT